MVSSIKELFRWIPGRVPVSGRKVPSVPELKAAAAGGIGGNESDSVALWLRNHALPGARIGVMS